MLVVELDADVECPLERIGETVAGAFLRVPVLELGESEKVGAGKVNPHHLPGVANLGCLKPEERRIAKVQGAVHSVVHIPSVGQPWIGSVWIRVAFGPVILRMVHHETVARVRGR